MVYPLAARTARSVAWPPRTARRSHGRRARRCSSDIVVGIATALLLRGADVLAEVRPVLVSPSEHSQSQVGNPGDGYRDEARARVGNFGVRRHDEANGNVEHQEAEAESQ